jgi:hypothetical protein
VGVDRGMRGVHEGGVRGKRLARADCAWRRGKWKRIRKLGSGLRYRRCIFSSMKGKMAPLKIVVFREAVHIIEYREVHRKLNPESEVHHG